jgi:NADH-quinone oxidoreductase subunit J
MGATVLFYLFAILAVFGATMVITRNHPIHSAVSLLGTFAAVAALYILLDAPFIAMVQITVYAGAILVLILFTIMLLNLRETGAGFLTFAKGGHGIATFVFAALLVAELLYVLISPDARPAAVPGDYPDAVLAQVGHTQALGELLFTKYVWPFEVVSVLLIVAIVGAVVLTRHRKTAQFAVYAPEAEEETVEPKTGA